VQERLRDRVRLAEVDLDRLDARNEIAETPEIPADPDEGGDFVTLFDEAAGDARTDEPAGARDQRPT
jgi:hypothetical protein